MNGKCQEGYQAFDFSKSSMTCDDKKVTQNQEILEDFIVKEVKILTYNLFMRPPLIKNNQDDYKNERCRLIINNEIAKFDIICFQELFRLFSNRRHKMVYSGIKKGFLYHVSSPQPNFFKSYFVDGGLTILSKYPIVESLFKPFSYGILADGLSQKGVLYAKIKINDKHIHVFNTHTQATYNTNEKEIKQTVIARLDQLVEMRQIIEECLKKYGFQRGDICISAGDFNVDSNHPIHPIHFISKQKKLKENIGIIDSQENFDEYKALLNILSSKGKDIVIDIGRQANNGQPPITFGDIYIDQYGQIQPLETALTYKTDVKSLQALDYIMQIIPNGMMLDQSNTIRPQTDHHISINMETYQNNTNYPSSGGGFSLQSSSNKLIKATSNNKQLFDKTFTIDFTRSRVEKFFVQGEKFTQLSDHYGISTTLIFQ